LAGSLRCRDAKQMYQPHQMEGAARRFTNQYDGFDEIVFCCYGGEDLATYQRILRVERL
jgi:hypothetical protein